MTSINFLEHSDDLQTSLSHGQLSTTGNTNDSLHDFELEVHIYSFFCLVQKIRTILLKAYRGLKQHLSEILKHLGHYDAN